jgi:hypothetical protein
MKKNIREKVWKKYDCKCAYCGNDLKYDKLQVDHINAKFLGGKDDISNYNPSCRECNFYKSTFTIDGFREQIATILDRVKKPFIVRLAVKYGLISFKPFDGLFYFEKHKPKALFINDVSQQRELLTDFLKDFFKGTHDVSDEDIKLKVQKYIDRVKGCVKSNKIRSLLDNIYEQK